MYIIIIILYILYYNKLHVRVRYYILLVFAYCFIIARFNI